MLVGVINCKCGQLFGFESAVSTINCPKCGSTYLTKDYGTEKEIIIEVEVEESEEDVT